MVTLLKQASWDAAKHIGSFGDNVKDPTKQTSIKLSNNEVAMILNCLEQNRPMQQTHDFAGVPTLKMVNFAPWMGKDKETGADTQVGFSLRVTAMDREDSTKKTSFSFGFTHSEGRLLREYLIHCLHNSFRAEKLAKGTKPSSSPKQPANVPAESEILPIEGKTADTESPESEVVPANNDILGDF
jgi:hypothetical protein